MDKVRKVMKEFKEGKLHSGSKKGPLVKSRDQAVAIAMSEKAKPMKNKMNSLMGKEGRGMAKADMQKTGMKGGGMTLEKHASMPASKAHKGLKAGGMAYKKGGSIDGCAVKGKTKGKEIKMAKGGMSCK